MRDVKRRAVSPRRSFLYVLALLSGAQIACRGDAEGRHAEFEALEQRWTIAQQSRDSAALERLLTSDFHLIEGVDGVPLPRDEYIAAVLHTTAEDTIRIEKIRLALWKDSATVRSRFHCTVVQNGQITAAYEFRTTDRWIHRDGRWLAASRTMVVDAD
ncbi:MAG: nuclear transport factor 2 family protein [Gemmatimonadales bacterium]|nr:MAG: nuclear transport factor 2 family protein [Gemmatimonadales bacterium]